MNQQTFSLSAEKREGHRHSARDARDAKGIPAVVYGHGVEPISISVKQSDMLRTYRGAGQSSLVDLDVAGKKIKVLVHEMSFHPVTRAIQHVDFFAVNLKEKTNVTVPVVFIGESPAIKNLGGLLVKEHDEIEVRCLPTDIPHQIEVDISKLENIGDHISVSNLMLDAAKFRVMLEPNTVICAVAAPKVIEEPETPVTEVLTEKAAEEGAAAAKPEEGKKEVKKEEKKEEKKK